MRNKKMHNTKKKIDGVDGETHNENPCIENLMPSKVYIDQECQVDECQFTVEPLQKQDPGKSFTCNRSVTVFIDSATKNMTIFNEVEIQTDIVLAKKIVIPSQKQYKSIGCNTITKVYVDSAVSVEPQYLSKKNRSFSGYTSLKTEEQIQDLAGVNFDTFQFLLERVPQPVDNCKLSQRDRLLILLMKIKTGLTFSTLSILFGEHRTTISKICLSTLQYLASSTANLIFWPTKAQVQATMPTYFYPDYNSTRVIIDCTEFKIEAPSDVDNQIHCFSLNERAYTAKILIGITPGGFICLKSKVAGGRTSDSQITIESGLIDLLEEGDTVLADKGFPEIQKVIDDNGKSAFIVIPPFLENKSESTKQEKEQTYKIASVRIHVERIIQRLKIYHILNKIPTSLFNYMDDLFHVICVLVNLQPPIHAEVNEEDENKEN